MKTTSHTAILPTSQGSALSRVGILVYGVLSYGIGVAGLCFLIGTTFGIVPFTGGPVSIGSTAGAIAFNLAFIALFGLQHAVMARPAFKERWTRVIPAAMERPTFVLVTGIIVSTTLALWQPLSTTVWSLESTAATVGLRGLALFGWVYLLAATFTIDHFELFGLKQVWRNFRGNEPPKLPIVARFLYRFDRHPIMTGFLIGLWATPVMRLDHLVLSAGLTAYIIVGVIIEERTLVAIHGDGYREYRRKVAALVPFPGRRK